MSKQTLGMAHCLSIAQSMKDNKTVGTDEWIEAVKTGMANNRRLRKQNVVIEKSE